MCIYAHLITLTCMHKTQMHFIYIHICNKDMQSKQIKDNITLYLQRIKHNYFLLFYSSGIWFYNSECVCMLVCTRTHVCLCVYWCFGAHANICIYTHGSQRSTMSIIPQELSVLFSMINLFLGHRIHHIS